MFRFLAIDWRADEPADVLQNPPDVALRFGWPAACRIAIVAEKQRRWTAHFAVFDPGQEPGETDAERSSRRLVR